MNNSAEEITVHELKTWPEYFQAIKSGKKTFEVRKNDRSFRVGDVLLLKEWKPRGYSDVSPNELTGSYTGEELKVVVNYIMQTKPHEISSFGIPSDVVVMSTSVSTKAVEAMKVLESLTPGGSEYFNDPEACMAIIKHIRDSQHKLIVELTKKIKSLQPTPKVEVETLAEKIFPFEDSATNPSCNHEYILSKMVEMYHKGAAQSIPQNNSGLRWVKASERLPEKTGWIHVRQTDTTPGTIHYTVGDFMPSSFEWLDESGKEAPQVAVECYVPTEDLANAIEKSGCKVTFGIQPNQIKRIEEEKGSNPDMRFSTHFWKKMGKEFAWDSFTLALYYFDHLVHKPMDIHIAFAVEFANYLHREGWTPSDFSGWSRAFNENGYKGNSTAWPELLVKDYIRTLNSEQEAPR